jgi:hypothetical protein
MSLVGHWINGAEIKSNYESLGDVYDSVLGEVT